ncbi:MAG: DUF4340 domain-containing protein [Myxococcota bacterium]|jgi:hypothetical protein
MSQSAKTLVMMAVLLVLAGGVGLYAYFGVYEKDAKATVKKDHDARLYTTPGDPSRDAGAAEPDFVKLVLTFQGETTVVEREPGKPWRVTAPVKGPADKLVVDAAISQLHSARFKDTLDEQPDAATLKRYGLDPPQFTLEAYTRSGGGEPARAVRLEGGIENTFDGSVFMRRNDEPAVYSAPGGVRYALAKTTFDLRDKQLLAVDEPKLVKIAVKARANSYTLERNAEKKWTLTGPGGDLADGNQVAGMLSALGNEKAQKFPDDTPENRATFGLEKPLVDATLTTDDGKTIRLRVAKGGTPEAVYALRESDDGAVLAEVPEAALADLDRNPLDLKDRTLLRFNKDLVTKIVFHNADGTEVVVSKDSPDASAEAWRVVAPREGKAQVFKITSVLWTLGAYKALSNVEENPKDWKKYGLGEQARAIILSGPDGELARLTIGNPVPGKADTFYVRGTRPVVVEVDGSRFKEFPAIVGDVLELPKAAPDAGADGGA